MMPEIFYLQLIAFLGGLVQGLTGFGVMLVALPLMAFFIDIKTAIPLIVLFGMVINLILIVQLSGHFETRKWLPMLIASIPAIPIGVWLQKTVSQRPLEVLVGIVLIATTANTWLHLRPKNGLGRVWGWATGFCAGLLAGSIGTSGPPVVIYTSLQPWTKSEIKATIVAFFMLNGTGVVIFYLFNGFFTMPILETFAWCALPLILGVAAGNKLYGQINDEIYRNTVIWLLGLLGVLMLLKG
jgi:hypothetical protein